MGPAMEFSTTQPLGPGSLLGLHCIRQKPDIALYQFTQKPAKTFDHNARPDRLKGKFGKPKPEPSPNPKDRGSLKPENYEPNPTLDYPHVSLGHKVVGYSTEPDRRILHDLSTTYAKKYASRGIFGIMKCVSAWYGR